MPCGIGWSKVLVRIAALVVAVPLSAVACGAQEVSEDDGTRPRYASDRERLLATCPAKAQGFFAWQQELAEKKGLERPVDENDLVLDPAASIAQSYLLTLPADQRSEVGIDSVGDRVIVQVTRGEKEVLADLREQVDDPNSITVQTVRWSSEDLGEFANRLETIRGSNSWGYGIGNANGRIEVDVPGDAGAARRKISKVLDPCAFTVRGNAPPMQPG
jgi:hypothetical protein